MNMMLDIASTESEETLTCSGKELLGYKTNLDEDQRTEEKGFSECLDSNIEWWKTVEDSRNIERSIGTYREKCEHA